MGHKYDPQKLDRLMSEERAKELSPEKLLRDEGLKEGDFFADIGSGPGFFSIPAARIVGERGIVFAIDTQKEMLLDLRDKRNPPQNIVLLLSEEDNIPVGDSEADFAFLAFVLHEVDNTGVFLKEIRRILREGGKFLVVDWKKQQEEKGPPIEERLTEEEVSRLLEKAGFKDIKTAPINQSHYKVSATK